MMVGANVYRTNSKLMTVGRKFEMYVFDGGKRGKEKIFRRRVMPVRGGGGGKKK